MKTLSAILISLLLMCLPGALALSASGYPAFDGAALPDDAFGASFGGEQLLLRFDPSGEYSNRMDGTLQLSFYAYDESGENLLELYLMLPEEPTIGDADFAAIYLYEVKPDGETLYFASQMNGAAVPENASLKLTLKDVESGADAISASGTLEATLLAYQDDLPTGEVLALSGAQFDFTLPLGADAALPESSAKPATPAFTLPPDYARV